MPAKDKGKKVEEVPAEPKIDIDYIPALTL